MIDFYFDKTIKLVFDFISRSQINL